MREIMMMQALNEALREEMRRDETVFILGEDVQGGAFLVTGMGLVQEFGVDRVMDTPISETAIAGAAVGAAMAGYRPVADLQFADFLFICGDEIFNKAAKWRFTHGGKMKLPLVIFATIGGYGSFGCEHSQSPESIVMHNPGLKLALPSTPYDGKGLLKTAIRDDDPVVFFYHKQLLAETGEVPEEEYTIPFGVADTKREEFARAVQSLLRGDEEHLEVWGLAIDVNLTSAEQGRTAEAIAHLREALRIKPDYPDARGNLDTLLGIRDNIDKDIAQLQELLVIHPQEPLLYDTLGNLYKRKGEFPKAVAAYQKALSFQSTYLPALNDLGLTYALRGDYEDAVSCFKKTITLQPNAPEAYYYLAGIYARQNKIADALQWLEQAVKKGFNDWELLKTDPNMENIKDSAYYQRLVTSDTR